MRIAYLVSQYPAASHTFIRREVTGLRALGFDVSTYSVRLPDGQERLAPVDREETESTWYVLPPRPARLLTSHARALLNRPGAYLRTLRDALGHRAPGLRNLVWSGFHFVEAIDLAAELRKQGVDHLHNHFANSGANVGYLASRFLGLDWSLTLHGTSEFDYPAGLLLPEKINAAKFVACVTHFGKAQAMRLVDPAQWQKFKLVRAGIEPPQVSRATPSERGGDSSTRPTRLVCVARLSPEKGHAGLLQAFAEVIREGRDATLELFGDGPERQRIEAEIQRLGIGERVTLHGQVPEQEALAAMAQGDAVVLASFMEGLPVVLMEALALGVPVVAPCVAGIPELVEHGVSGLTFPPGDWQALSVALKRLMDEPGLNQSMASEGQRRVEEGFFVERSLQPLVEAFGGNPR